ncbi:hypothetical protein Ccr5_gp329 [Caulobacter phage Ccr5]|nr:hypothetical protein Ccr5_gp011 [Caulobacter phage Ccr5]ARB14549.1 hypothetical protein Ccr5_gp329 [Caulobacter phage Ccr5]
MRTTKAQRFAAVAFDALAKALSEEPRRVVSRVTKWEGAGHSFANLQRDYERYGPGRRSWFGRDEMRFFGTRLEAAPLDFPALRVTLFLTSETPPGAGRVWTLRAYLWDSADIETLTRGDETDAATAQAAFDLLWPILSGR